MSIASITLAAKQVLGAIFTFFRKSKFLFGFHSVSVNRYQGRFFIMATWRRTDFRKAGGASTP